MIPFVTEELWTYLDGSGELLAAAPYPRPSEASIDLEAEVVIERLIEAVTLVRAWRDSVGARAGLIVSARLRADGYEPTAALLARLARLELAGDAPRGESYVGDARRGGVPPEGAHARAGAASG